MTPIASARIQSSEAKNNSGQVAKDSFTARAHAQQKKRPDIAVRYILI